MSDSVPFTPLGNWTFKWQQLVPGLLLFTGAGLLYYGPTIYNGLALTAAALALSRLAW